MAHTVRYNIIYMYDTFSTVHTIVHDACDTAQDRIDTYSTVCSHPHNQTLAPRSPRCRAPPAASQRPRTHLQRGLDSSALCLVEPGGASAPVTPWTSQLRASRQTTHLQSPGKHHWPVILRGPFISAPLYGRGTTCT